ncbi:transposase [Candidatus Enterovibrio escicola]|uniref:transposase n=1 Tax=Candidatus Enterovibrio escicola TaxID=1927127 RepID=UPI001CC253ED
MTFKELCLEFDAKLSECNGEGNHVHLLISTSPNTFSVAKLVYSLKSVSYRRLRWECYDIAGLFSQNVLFGKCSLITLLIFNAHSTDFGLISPRNFLLKTICGGTYRSG